MALLCTVDMTKKNYHKNSIVLPFRQVYKNVRNELIINEYANFE